ncbi:MAG: helix-turn-helix domain-containing protein [Faecousia sp.]
MNFSEMLKEYMEMLHCTAKELSDASGLSPATVSRYRSGERVPAPNSDAFDRLCNAIILLSGKGVAAAPLTREAVIESFLRCPDFIASDQELFRQKLNTLIAVLKLNLSKLCRCTNYEASALFRIRSGSRKPSEPAKLAADIARYVAETTDDPTGKESLAELLGCPVGALSDISVRFEKVLQWLTDGQERQADSMARFLEKLDDFDLDEYIRAIHFDTLKVPSVPFQLPTSKTYRGLEEMMASELDFLKATVLSKSQASVIMYSDMPMEEMAKDPDFPKRWMYGMAMLLKKGLHLHVIHNIDRPLPEMMLGLESWIPMYMTGQVSPYYLKNPQNDVFLHFLKVSGTAALTGEAIAGYHGKGMYYLTKSREEVAYYRCRAESLLQKAHPLMQIYRQNDSAALHAFLRADAELPGKRRNCRSAPPLYTIQPQALEALLRRHALSEAELQDILRYAEAQRQMTEKILQTEIIEDEIPLISEEEFARHPIMLTLSGIFYEEDIPYTYAEYRAHLSSTEQYAALHPNYRIRKTAAHAFRNLQISLHEGQWAMVSKSKSPAIHFVIHHPKLREAIECFQPPFVEE